MPIIPELESASERMETEETIDHRNGRELELEKLKVLPVNAFERGEHDLLFHRVDKGK